MGTSTYVLPVAPAILVHETDDLPVWLGDYGEGVSREFNIADAMAASGDYFITLATRLDLIAQGLKRDSPEQIELEHLVTTLFYMQDHYDLTAKYKRR
jgi:hypothetical protein